jgi:hypothetical protein
MILAPHFHLATIIIIIIPGMTNKSTTSKDLESVISGFHRLPPTATRNVVEDVDSVTTVHRPTQPVIAPISIILPTSLLDAIINNPRSVAKIWRERMESRRCTSGA